MTKSKVRKLISLFMIVAFTLMPYHGYAQPNGANVVVGDVTISELSNGMDINIDSNKAIINWQGFSIASDEFVNFAQLSPSAVALNRVVGSDVSSIRGALNANGKIFLVNPNGVLFGATAQINAAGLVASTLNISDDDFLAGRYTFYGQGGSVINRGYISSPGGYVSLLGASVENAGTIEAELGTVALASGEMITLNLDSQGLMSVAVDEGLVDNLTGSESAVKNSGTISANGGKVVLTVETLSGVFDNAINNEGIIEANTLNDRKGSIELISNGAINSNGMMSADGGTIEICTEDILTLGGTYKAQEILFDPIDLVLGADGPLYLDGDATFWAWRDITVVDDISNVGGDLSFFADAWPFDNGVGDFIQSGGTLISAAGDIFISGANITLANLLSGNDIGVFASNLVSQRLGTDIAANNNIGIYGNSLSLENVFFGGDTFDAVANNGSIDVNGLIQSIDVLLNYGTVDTFEVGQALLFPTADAQVSYNSRHRSVANSNYGYSSSLDTYYSSGGWFSPTTRGNSWLKFDLSSLTDVVSIDSAILQLYASSTRWGSNKIGAYHSSNDVWAENGITWNNAPSANGTPTAIRQVNRRWNDWAVTSDVNADIGDGYSSWVLKPIGSGGANFRSRQRSGTTYDPRLKINYTYLNQIDMIYGYGVEQSQSGAINLTASDNINFTNSGALSTLGNVNVTAQTGSIIDQTGPSVNISANNINLSAGQNIGFGDPIDTDAESISAYAGNYISIADAGEVIFAEIINGAGDEESEPESVYLTSQNDMYVGYVSDPFDVTLTSNAGSIIGLDTEGVNVQTLDLTMDAAVAIVGES
ncbi:MAG: filamentous hemagglutinin N-terminal domain-containing protein, partial [Candidatus Omnitrophica bacterium]|nr:filamentous hemagglutinin N-terminal domain-containing protein [Candidatus Omnitrophota bacterium]